MVKWDNVTRAHVLRAMKEYDRLGPEAFFSDRDLAPPRRTIWSRTGAVTRPKQSLAPPMSSPPASALPLVTSRAGRLVPSPCSETWDSCQGSTGSQETLSTATDTCPSPFLLSGAQIGCGLGESSARSTSGAGARANRHPVRSGQQADGRNRNENPVAGRGPASDAPYTTCPTHGTHQTLTSSEFAVARRP